VALPFLVVSLEGALRTSGERYEAVAATLGARPTTVFRRVTMPLVLPGLAAGAVLSFARSLGEFGATITFAGSLQGVTRTLPLEIYLQREVDPDAAVALSLAATPLLPDVEAVLAETGLPPHLLQIELTERALTSDEGAPLKALDGLRALGVRIAIDDFGTGYSNLSYLRKLPVDVIKLDGSFGEGLREADVTNPVDERIVGTLVELGHALGMTVCAEGVETPAQATRLRRLGCDEGQGWHFAAALPREDVLDVLRDPDGPPWPGPADDVGGSSGS